MINAGNKPLVIAHRGACTQAPENTIAAFELAIEHGADMIELDAKLSADGHIVVIHDTKVDRTTNGTGFVHELTLIDLKQLDASYNHVSKFKGETIPTLDEILHHFGNSIAINIELSNYQSPFDPLPEKVARLLEAHRLENIIVVSSFNPLSLRRFQQLKPEIPIGLLVKPGFLGKITGSKFGEFLVSYQSLHPERSLITPELIRTSNQHRRRIYPFTINSPQEMKRVLSLKVDGIITDDPLTARNVIVSLNLW